MAKLSDAGLLALKQFEGCRLDAYEDEGGVWTIGYGDTSDVKPGDRITLEEADRRFRNRVQEFERVVDVAVRKPLSQGMFDVLVSLAYNIGAGAFRSSTLVALLNNDDIEGAALQLGRFIYVRAKEPTELRRGDKGEQVTAWQRELRDAGYVVKLDGDFGPATENATRLWQHDHKQMQDGVARVRMKVISGNLVARRMREIVRFLRS